MRVYVQDRYGIQGMSMDNSLPDVKTVQNTSTRIQMVQDETRDR